MSQEFLAQWGGRCGICEGAIRPGDWACYVDDELSHADCDEGTSIRRAAETVCPECFLTSCDCGAES